MSRGSAGGTDRSAQAPLIRPGCPGWLPDKEAGGRLSPRKAHRRDRQRAKKPMNRRQIRRRRRATPFVGTHNHFVLDRGGKVFNRTVPAIKLEVEAGEEDHIELLGLLNSSTACFWMKQVCHNKGSTIDQHGARQRTAPFEDFYEYDGIKLKQFPVPEDRPLDIARELDFLAQERTNPSLTTARPSRFRISSLRRQKYSSGTTNACQPGRWVGQMIVLRTPPGCGSTPSAS